MVDVASDDNNTYFHKSIPTNSVCCNSRNSPNDTTIVTKPTIDQYGGRRREAYASNLISSSSSSRTSSHSSRSSSDNLESCDKVKDPNEIVTKTSNAQPMENHLDNRYIQTTPVTSIMINKHDNDKGHNSHDKLMSCFVDDGTNDSKEEDRIVHKGQHGEVLQPIQQHPELQGIGCDIGSIKNSNDCFMVDSVPNTDQSIHTNNHDKPPRSELYSTTVRICCDDNKNNDNDQIPIRIIDDDDDKDGEEISPNSVCFDKTVSGWTTNDHQQMNTVQKQQQQIQHLQIQQQQLQDQYQKNGLPIQQVDDDEARPGNSTILDPTNHTPMEGQFNQKPTIVPCQLQDQEKYQELHKEEQHDQQKQQQEQNISDNKTDPSTFAWTIATKKRGAAVIGIQKGQGDSRYFSAPSSSSLAFLSSLSNKKEAAMLLQPRNDFFLSSVSSKLLADGTIKQPSFFWTQKPRPPPPPPRPPQWNTNSKTTKTKTKTGTSGNTFALDPFTNSGGGSTSSSSGSSSSNGFIRLDTYSNYIFAMARSKVAVSDAATASAGGATGEGVGTSLASFAHSQQHYGSMHDRLRRQQQQQQEEQQEQEQRQHQRMLLKQRIRFSAVLGAVVGGVVAVLLLVLFPQLPIDILDLWYEFTTPTSPYNNNNNNNNQIKNTMTQHSISPSSTSIFTNIHHQQRRNCSSSSGCSDTAGAVLSLNLPDIHQQHELQQEKPVETTMKTPGSRFLAHLDLFHLSKWFQVNYDENSSPLRIEGNSGHDDWRKQKRSRTLISSDISTSTSSSLSSKSASGNSNSPLLVIAGKMTVEGGPCNIAQYNLKTGEWSLDERIQLSLYNSYSGGEVYSLLANYTTSSTATVDVDGTSTGDTVRTYRGSGTSSTATKKQVGSGELIVVGAFDTTYRNSQVTYCSVGVWDGSQLSKVGEGLCNSALSKGMKITTASLAGPQDVYVAGSFQTQVWNGERNEFVKIFNIAHFNAVEQVWLPLNVGQISCSWCTVTVLALAWDSKRRQLHVAGKFNSIDGRNVPAGLAIYDYDSGHLVAHPGGGLSMLNISQDGVGTALQLDEESGVLYVMGSFERLTQTYEVCDGLAAYEIEANRWTCLADAAHTVYPTGGGNMLLTPYGLMVAGKTTPSTTWRNPGRPYTIALLKTTLKTWNKTQSDTVDDDANNRTTGSVVGANATNTTNATTASTNTTLNNTIADQDNEQYHYFNWSWLPGFKGHDEPLHALTNGFGEYEGSVFIAGDNLVARWSYQPAGKYDTEEAEQDTSTIPPGPIQSYVGTNSTGGSDAFDHLEPQGDGFYNDESWENQGQQEESGSKDTLYQSSDEIGQRRQLAVDNRYSSASVVQPPQPPKLIPVTEVLSLDSVRGAIMAISQMMPEINDEEDDTPQVVPVIPGATYSSVNITIIVYCVTVGCVIGVIGAILCNRNISGALFPFNSQEKDFKGFSLDTLTYSAVENTNIMDAYQRAMKTRYVHHPNLLTIIDPQEIFLQRIIGEGTFGRVWSARWRTASVAVKEFVFAQAAVAGKSSQQQQIVEEIIGEAGMMAILRHPNVLQLFGCSLTAQAIWIVSELCSLGSLRQLLDDNDRVLPVGLRLSLALQVAEGMTYLHNQVPPIIHRDLKSHNIFVHETFTDSNQDDANSTSSNKRKDGSEKMETHSTIVARIGDWGSARASLSGSRTMTHGVGTACWLAPEVIKHARSSKFSDVYGYGIVLWELATREEVYQGLETTQIIAKVANENLRPPVPKDCPWKDLMVKCWAENPQDRLEFHEIDAVLNDLSKRLQESTSSSGLSNASSSGCASAAASGGGGNSSVH